MVLELCVHPGLQAGAELIAARRVRGTAVVLLLGIALEVEQDRPAVTHGVHELVATADDGHLVADWRLGEKVDGRRRPSFSRSRPWNPPNEGSPRSPSTVGATSTCCTEADTSVPATPGAWISSGTRTISSNGGPPCPDQPCSKNAWPVSPVTTTIVFSMRPVSRR